ncbi:MAG: magnesium transporter [Panacagrimonas sp.]|jgi:magnesium transporter|nr:magnesium transporter [Panacagrimonas sp.]MCC2656066.1 magnesium transporter [Panacagrimonas sp.]
MSETIDKAELARLTRAVRARVPLDAAQLLARESPERVGEVLADLPQDLADRIQSHLPPELRRQAAEELAEAVAGTVHEMMEPALAVLPAATTVAMAIEYLRTHPTPQQITYVYVTGSDDRLIGLVVIRDLLLGEPEDTLAEVMLPDPFALPVDMEAGEAIKAALHRHYPVYPVIDGEQHIVGVIRGWRLFERQAVEISAQSGQMVGVDKEERLGTTFWAAFRMRHPWLQVNLLTAFLAGFVVSIFEGTITQIVALAAFLPILAGQSGNTGCQALAITLRGITLGDMDKFRVGNLVRKEMLLGATNGLLTGLVAGVAMWWSASRGGGDVEALRLGVVIVLAMVGACMISGMFGVLVPLTLRRFGADPATASSIFLTTGTDIAGMGLMLLLATMIVL